MVGGNEWNQGRNLKQDLVGHAQELAETRCGGAHATLVQWTEAVASGRVEKVLGLYAPDAILVPTLSNEIIVAEAGRRSYFEFFLSDGGPTCTVNCDTTRIDDKLGTVAIGGIYTFCFPRPTGEETVPARFLFTFEELEGRWLITGQHSSRCV